MTRQTLCLRPRRQILRRLQHDWSPCGCFDIQRRRTTLGRRRRHHYLQLHRRRVCAPNLDPDFVQRSDVEARARDFALQQLDRPGGLSVDLCRRQERKECCHTGVRQPDRRPHRRREQKFRPELKEAWSTFRKNPESLDPNPRAESEILTQSNAATVKAYKMRSTFQDAYQLGTVEEARRRLQA